MSTDTRLSPFREDSIKTEKEPSLPLAQARLLAQQTIGVGGIDDMAMGIAGLGTGVLISLLGNGDPGVLLSEAIIPVAILFGLLYWLSATLKRKFVVPRIGKVKPPKTPGVFSFYSFALYTGLHYALGGTGPVPFWQTIAIGWCAATFSIAMFAWQPRFFAVPLAIVTLLRLQAPPDGLLIGVGLTYLAVGTAVFWRFIASAGEGGEEIGG
jgi:hypothetical protein